MSEYSYAFLMMVSALSSSPGVPSGSVQTDQAALRAAAKTVWVSRPTGRLQCEDGTGETRVQAKKSLVRAGIRVRSSKTVLASAPVITLCGAPTGEEHAFLIDASALERAVKLGFRSITKP